MLQEEASGGHQENLAGLAVTRVTPEVPRDRCCGLQWERRFETTLGSTSALQCFCILDCVRRGGGRGGRGSRFAGGRPSRTPLQMTNGGITENAAANPQINNLVLKFLNT